MNESESAPPPTTPRTGAPRTRIRVPRIAPEGRSVHLALRLAFELLVVFAGVYAAFALSEHQQRKEAAERRHQVRLALIREIEEITANTGSVASELERAKAFYETAIGRGETPPLQPLMGVVQFRPHVWEASLQSGGLDLFDVPTLYRLSEFYNKLNFGFDHVAQLRRLSETMILPHVGRHPEAFYDPATGALRPEYGWYLSGMRDLQGLAAGITALGDSLVTELGTPGGPAPS